MKVDTSTVSPECQEEGGMAGGVNTHGEMENSTVQDIECGDNCLNGIKWPLERYQKKSSKAALTFNGFGRLKPTLVTHGGRTSKLPARFIESDSDGEYNSKRKGQIERRKKEGLLGKVGNKRKKICKNGRSKSLTEKFVDVTESFERNRFAAVSKEDKGDRIETNLRLNLTSCCLTDGYNNCADTHSPTTSRCLKRAFDSFQTDSSSSGDSPKRKRGRPSKKQKGICKVKSDEDDRNRVSPHGNCVMSATKATLASPSTSKFAKKRKKTGDVRNSRDSCTTSSSDESSTGTPKRRGRPPKFLLASSSAKKEIFETQNGVKPWVRPALKAEKCALFRSPTKHLDSYMASSDQVLRKVKKRKVLKVNGVGIPFVGEEAVKPKRRGRPPKESNSMCKGKKAKSDVFHFTDDEDVGDNSKSLMKSKLKKLQLHGKRPMGVVKFKKKAVEKAKSPLKNKMKAPTSGGSVDKSAASSDQASPDQQQRSSIDKVLGMKRSPTGCYEYLVQWKDGTSCWVPSNQLEEFELDFRNFLVHNCQDLPVVNRLPFKAYWHENLFEHHQANAVTESYLEAPGEHCQEERTLKERSRTSTEKVQLCKEVSVRKSGDCVHIVVSRSSSKRTKVNQRIIEAVIAAMEDASDDSSDYVRISGLGEEFFCGLDLNTLTALASKEEARRYRRDVDRVR